MAFGDIKLNMVFDNGSCRCHGQLSPVRTISGDVARVTDPLECIYQRLGIWLATKKGERPLHPEAGCCIREYYNAPLTGSKLLDLEGEITAELIDIFPEYDVQSVDVTSPDRNTVKITATIGESDVEFLVNPGEISRLEAQFSRVLSDLGMGD